MRAIVAVVAVVAAAVVAGVVYATRQDPAQPKARCKNGVPAGIYPGRRSANVAAVRHGAREGPKRAARALEALAAEHPNDPVVQFNDGDGALLRRVSTPRRSRRSGKAKKAGRDTRYEVAADNILHPQYFQQGLPARSSTAVAIRCSSRVRSRSGNYHQRTAERLWARAARLHPNDADAQVAAAVGRFDMDDSQRSFSRLGPLVKRFPNSQTVRFHLGLLLAWTGQGEAGGEGVRRRARARADDDAREGSKCLPRASREEWD